MIAIVDYGAGNIASVAKAVAHLGHPCSVTNDECDVLHASKLIIPGVGNFKATEPLTRGAIADALKQQIAAGTPVLGICLGLQWLFSSSDEAPELTGLGFFRGSCHSFSNLVKSPHVGWNQLELAGESRLLRGVADKAYVYFTHSYRAPVCDATIATCFYEDEFTAAAERQNIFGVQFHPEKSGDVGLTILGNFCAL